MIQKYMEMSNTYFLRKILRLTGRSVNLKKRKKLQRQIQILANVIIKLSCSIKHLSFTLETNSNVKQSKCPMLGNY